jgi:ribonuclease HI
MELFAVIMGLSALKETCKVRLNSDSQYVVNAMTKSWVQKWVKKDWKKVKNPDLWQQLVELTGKHQVEFNWVKGHAGITENERCDQLAFMAAKAKNLPVDNYYENNLNSDAPEEEINVVSPKENSAKIIAEGQPCNKCNTPVIKRTRPENKPVKEGSSYYFEYYFICPGCGTMYMVEEAKVLVK